VFWRFGPSLGSGAAPGQELATTRLTARPTRRMPVVLSSQPPRTPAILVIWGGVMGEVSVGRPNLDSRGRPLIYAVGPDGDGDGITPMRRWPALLRCALAGMVMLAVGFGSAVLVIELVLAPNFPTLAVDEELRAPFAAQIGQRLDQHGAEPTAIVGKQPSVPPGPAESRRPVSQRTDGTSASVDDRPGGRPQMVASAVIRAGHKLRCAHNAASVR
jgi:hypothetical protein